MACHVAPTDSGLWGLFFCTDLSHFRMIRSAFFIDGFNLYHALKRLGPQYLKWVDLNALMGRLIAPKSERMVAIYYFSAYAHWLPDQWKRHQEYVAALRYSPPELGHSNDLTLAARNKRRIKRRQVEESLFPAVVVDGAGNVIATRPSKYDPPSAAQRMASK
jgi:hypothetical protein